MSAPPDETRSTQEFEALIEYLKNHRGFDFSGYKRSSLRRRMDKRMQALRLERYGDYVDFLEVHPEEFTQLFNTILINQYLCQLRKAAGGLRSMITTQAGDFEENLA